MKQWRKLVSKVDRHIAQKREERSTRDERERAEVFRERGGPLFARYDDAIDAYFTAEESGNVFALEAARAELNTAHDLFLAQADEVGDSEKWPFPVHLLSTTHPVPLNSEINPAVSLSTPPPFRSNEREEL